MDLARAPRRAPLTARKKGSGYENVLCLVNTGLAPGFAIRAMLGDNAQAFMHGVRRLFKL
jgi:hypothetical protein